MMILSIKAIKPLLRTASNLVIDWTKSVFPLFDADLITKCKEMFPINPMPNNAIININPHFTPRFIIEIIDYSLISINPIYQNLRFTLSF